MNDEYLIESGESENFIYRIELEQFQDDSFDPRQWNNLGIIATWHRNYRLGDEQPQGEPIDHMIGLIQKYDSILDKIEWYEDYDLDYTDMVYKMFNKYYVSLPVYMYDHGGISISTGSFNDSWDSGQLGFIYISKEQIRKEYNWKIITKKRKTEIEKYLNNEIEEYNNYLTGEVYCYVICNKKDPDNIIESCTGYLGYNNIEFMKKECEDLLLQFENEKEEKEISYFTNLYK